MPKNWLSYIRRDIHLPLYCALLAVANLVLFNIPFLQYAYGESHKVGVLVSLVLLVVLLNFFACYLVCGLLHYAGRILVAVAHVLSTLSVYYVVTYHVMMDETMIGNVFNTQYSEASGFLTWSMFLVVTVIGLLPLLFILGARVRYGSLKDAAKWMGGSLLLSLGIVGINFDSVLWVGEHDTELGGLTMPWSYTVNTVRHFNAKRLAGRPQTLLPDATFRTDTRQAVVLVIGESARQANFSLYGYGRETNPLLSKVEGLHVFDARSCATYTTAGVQAILEHEESRTLYEILPNYLYRNGADVEWRTTNWGEAPVHVAGYLKAKDLADGSEDDGYDGVLLHGLAERIRSSQRSKVLIVLHTSTSHGPAYCDKYPPKFGVYAPVCDNVEAAAEHNEELVNAYDNSILYTDYLLHQVITLLQGLEGWQTTMFYISDHGESLGEDGLYMHGVPLKLAPSQQYVIPCLVWTSDTTRVARQTGVIDQHSVFHTVLGLLDCESPVYQSDKDLFE